jgi:hypothetical protein
MATETFIGAAYLTYHGHYVYVTQPSNDDPFTQVYKAILSVLENDPCVQLLVQSANWIKFGDKDTNPFKRNAQPGDAPEILIEPVTGQDQWAETSTSAKGTVVWSIKVATQDPRLYFTDANGNRSGVFPLRWAIMRALDAAGDNLGLSFLRVTRITASVTAPFDPAGNPVSEGRGTDGWTLLATLTTEMDLPRVAGILQDV